MEQLQGKTTYGITGTLGHVQTPPGAGSAWVISCSLACDVHRPFFCAGRRRVPVHYDFVQPLLFGHGEYHLSMDRTFCCSSTDCRYSHFTWSYLSSLGSCAACSAAGGLLSRLGAEPYPQPFTRHRSSHSGTGFPVLGRFASAAGSYDVHFQDAWGRYSLASSG